MVVYNNNDIDAIVFEIKNNKALIAPTDTIPGILAKNKNTIYRLKKRNRNKKIILFVCSWKHIKDLNNNFIKLARHFWPGNLTIVKNGISYRVPRDKFLLEIISRTGPLYCSSANLSGYNVIKNYQEAYDMFEIFGTEVIYLDGNYCVNKPSTVYDIDKDRILREGEITHEQIRNIIQN